MKLSVIVCTRDRAHAILPCLDSIVQSLSQAAPVDAEIVVVDNGSTDATSSLLRDWAATCPFPVNIQFEPRKGVCNARNRALSVAKGELLVFTDDDCRLDKNHITAALQHDARDTELVFRGGRVELGDPQDLPLSIKTETATQYWQKDTRPDNFDLHCAFIGANMTMRRALADKIGLFDERFGPGTSLPGGDDVDYIFRAYLAGVRVEYVPDMVVFHHHGRRTSSAGHKLMRNYMVALGGQYAKYIFRHFDFCRPAYWDLKKALREIVFKEKFDGPNPYFSFKHLVAYNMLGSMNYLTASVKKQMSGART